MPNTTPADVLILATNGFEQSELFEPRQALLDAGINVTLASIDLEPIQGMKHDVKGDTIKPDMTLSDVRPDAYAMLVLPGGVANPDTLRMQPEAVQITQAFFADSKPVAAICHGPWLLAEADVVAGRKMTSWPSIRTDLRNAGADVTNAEVVVDGNLITSRKPDDIPAFNRAILDALNEVKTG